VKRKRNSEYLRSTVNPFLLFVFFLAFIPMVESQVIVISGDESICTGEQAALHAEATGVNSIGSSSYSFSYTDFNNHPPFSGGIAIDPDFIDCNWNYDDCWAGGNPPSAGYDIGFSFCFFNEEYSNFYVGSNGWIGFSDPTNQWWTTFTATPIPNTNSSVPKNCIFAPWQDWYPGVNGTGPHVFYYTTGSAPSRKLVVYWLDCPLYNCQDNEHARGTFMIVLNEGTNIIENYLQKKTNCPVNPEGATQGVHNTDGTIAFTVPGRNYEVWQAINEGTLFEPSGIIWYQDAYPGGLLLGYGPDIVVNPIITTPYFAVLGTCNGNVVTDNWIVTVNPTPPDPVITGQSEVCQGVAYTYTTQTGMTAYDWTVPNGQITGGGDSYDYIEVIWNTPGSVQVQVTYSSAEGCPALNPGNFPITVNAFDIPSIEGVEEICRDETTIFTTQPGMQAYLWTYPEAEWISGGGISENFVEHRLSR